MAFSSHSCLYLCLPGSREGTRDIQGMHICTFFPLFFLSHCRLSNVASRRGIRLHITFIAVSMLPAVCLWRQTLCLAEAFNTEGLGWSLRGSVLMPVYVFVSIHDRPSLNMCVFSIHKLLGQTAALTLALLKCVWGEHLCVCERSFFFFIVLSKSAYDATIPVICSKGACRVLPANLFSLQWLHGTRIL